MQNNYAIAMNSYFYKISLTMQNNYAIIYRVVELNLQNQDTRRWADGSIQDGQTHQQTAYETRIHAGCTCQEAEGHKGGCQCLGNWQGSSKMRQTETPCKNFAVQCH